MSKTHPFQTELENHGHWNIVGGQEASGLLL